MKKIYYYPTESGFGTDDELLEPEKSILSDDRFSFPIESVISNADKRTSYYECPAWSHKAKRTFIVRSPIDIRFDFDFSKFKETGEVFVNSPHISGDTYNVLTGPTYESPKWYLTNPEKLVMQLTAPHFIFWTKEKNIWIEQRSHPNTSAKNNIVVVNGWFNISSWPRTISFAYDVYDHKKSVIIKRGDPIYEVCFYSKNIDDRFQLVKKEPPEDIKLKLHRNINLKRLSPTLSKDFMFGQQEKESKCPFSFLWKN